MHFPNVPLQYTLHYVRMMDNATHLMAQEPATVQLMHKTPSLWTRAGVPWIFGHDPNKYRTSIPPCNLPPKSAKKSQQITEQIGGPIFQQNRFPVPWILVRGSKHTFLPVAL